MNEEKISRISEELSPREIKVVSCASPPKNLGIEVIQTEEFPDPPLFLQMMWALLEGSDALVIDGSFPSILSLFLAQVMEVNCFYLGKSLIRLPRMCPIKPFYRKLIAEVMRRREVSTSELARKIGLSDKSGKQKVANALKELERAGILFSRKVGNRKLWSTFQGRAGDKGP